MSPIVTLCEFGDEYLSSRLAKKPVDWEIEATSGLSQLVCCLLRDSAEKSSFLDSHMILK